ncbi:MAG: TonB-dependent receptor [Prevotellaceae bacterium]|jgi:iron complex outermembrane receptor protein|nr:TonB-dependent receptor [Prevotellaceae bacterium]
MKKTFKLFLLVCCASLAALSVQAQQTKTITGTVLDKDKEPVMSATVQIDGTQVGTMTDMDGNFELTVPEGATLKVSMMGYEVQTKKVGASTTHLDFTLQDDAKAIELAAADVVGIGYGTMRKGDLTGAIASVNAKDMKQGVVTSSEQLLQGKVAGLNVVQGSGDPTRGAVVRLRGGTSLSGDNSPLVVVDGVAGIDMNTIPAADIVSMDVLKDASASAIYGSRAANGVIIVTTKRKDVESRSANYTGYFGVAKAANKLDLLDAGAWKNNRDDIYDYGTNTDWQEKALQTALTHSHALTFSNISKSGGFKGTISYLNSEGIVQTSELERLGATLSGFTNLWNDRLTLELGLSKNKDDYSEIDYKSFFETMYRANPTWPVRNADGSFFKDPTSTTDLYNPLEILQDRYSANTRDRFMGYLKADVYILRNKEKGKENEGLKGTVNLSYNSTDTQSRFYLPIVAQRQSASDGMKGSATRSQGIYTQKQIEAYLNYDKTFESIHKLNVMAGYSYGLEGGEGFGVGVYHFDYDEFLYNALDAAKNLVKVGENEYQMSGAQYSYSYKDESKLASFFGRANYSFMSRYMLTATLRADGSSKFGKNHKWGYFPSASLAWRISDEAFMANTREWLDNLKLRLGYGITGNQGGISSYSSVATYKPADGNGENRLEGCSECEENENNSGIPIRAFEKTRNANEDLKWESTAQFNAGLDFEILKKRLSGTIEVYHKKTNDLLYFYYIGATSPVHYTLMNVGNLENTGIEFSLNGTILTTKDFSWTANLNLAHNKNKVTKLSDAKFPDTPLDMGLIEGPVGPYDGMSSYKYSQKLREGYSVGSFFGAKTAGIDPETGKLRYVVKDQYGGLTTTTSASDLKDEDRQYYLGNAMPKLNVGFGMNFAYKKFDASINTYGIFGQKVYNATAMVLSTGQDRKNVLTSSLDKQTTNCVSDYWLEDASFFRLQSITLGYTFDLKKIYLNSVRVYATVENPFVLSTYTGVDPEVSIDMDVTKMNESEKRSPGIDNFDNYPKPRTFMIGLNLQF